MADNQRYEERSNIHERYAEGSEEAAGGKRCPHCGSTCIATADLCEACGQWLLDGQCRYCYQPFKPGQRFCTHCGNPPEGIVCKQCNVKTHFDVCPTCHSPLSRRAGPAQEAMREEGQMILDAVREMMTVATEDEAKRLKKALGQLEDYYGQDPPAAPAGGSPAAGFGFTGEQADVSAELRKSKAAEQARVDKASAEAERQAEDQARIDGVNKRIERVERDKKNALLADKIRKLQERTFPDAQSARMYSMQVQGVLEHLGVCESWLGWKCNRFGCVHYNGPMGCSAPESGGRWVCESEVIHGGRAGEFVLDGIPHSPHSENPQASCP